MGCVRRARPPLFSGLVYNVRHISAVHYIDGQLGWRAWILNKMRLRLDIG